MYAHNVTRSASRLSALYVRRAVLRAPLIVQRHGGSRRCIDPTVVCLSFDGDDNGKMQVELRRLDLSARLTIHGFVDLSAEIFQVNPAYGTH